MPRARYDHYQHVGKPAEKRVTRKKRPKAVAVIDEDNCTGCQVCVPFCPTDCIKPVPADRYTLPIPPVQVVYADCIGCRLCYHACNKLTWDAIRMLPTAEFESLTGVDL